MMRHKTLSTALIWLAGLALAAQGFGAPALLDACACQTCECGQPAQEKSCCEDYAAQPDWACCGPSCCQTSSHNFAQATRIPGSCCCVVAGQSVPANLPKSDKANPENPLPQAAFEAAAAPPATPSVILLTDVHLASPPPRILYCVWRI